MEDHDHDDHLDETDPSLLSTLSGIKETNDDVLLHLLDSSRSVTSCALHCLVRNGNNFRRLFG
jgi:hypothetical protein